jgi:type IV pilus assembly protein PilY1
VTSAKLTTESVVYLAEFNTNRWQGTIYAYRIADLDTGILNDTYEWSAAEQLLTKNPASRTILTYDSSGSGSGPQGIAFRWANLKTAMLNDLKTSATGTTDSDTIGEARLDYIRGDRSNEGQGYLFRERTSILGDIVNSGPVYVGKPGLRIPNKAPFPTGANAYSTFQTAQQNRAGMIYVGANDGMLHGFAEANGDERIAYIPSNLFSTDTDKGLHYLTHQNYIHQNYNDLTPTVSDVFINGAWKTILVAGQRAGGKGYSALDVTNPASFSEGNAGSLVLWEFTHADLGYTYSQPQIAMTDSGDWVAIFGNGYNSGDGVARLFIVNIAAGLDGSWDVGDYKIISTGSGDAGNKNGLSTPALADIDKDGTVDRAYAGDLNGNLWVFDLDGSADSWALHDPANDGSPLFVTDAGRPITAKPILAFHPNEPYDEDNNHPNVMVFVGTGQYLVEADKTSTDDDYFYGVWDKGTSGLTSSNLVEQEFRSGFGVNRVLTQNAVDYSIKYGWKIQLNIAGERSVTNPAVRENVVIFNSTIPTSDACTSGGYGYRYAVDIATGGTPSSPVLDRDKDGIVDENDTIGEDHVVPSADELTSMPTDNTFTDKVGYTGKDPFSISELRTPQIGRFSWQELLR